MLVFGFVLLAVAAVGASAAELGSYSEADKYTHKVDLLIATGKQAEAASVYRGLVVLTVFIFLRVGRWSSLLKSLFCLLYILAY